MNFFKKSLILFLAILLCASVYHDITTGSISSKPEKEKENYVQTVSNKSLNFIKVQVLPGETILSIVEKYSDNIKSLDINQIVSDFEKLNEGAHPYHLKAHQSYNFPVYTKGE